MASIKLKNGATMGNGMIAVPGFRANTMEKDSLLHPRNGAPKRQAAPAIAHGMKRATKGELHPYLHGQAINDEVDDKLHMTGKNVPLTYGTKATLAQFADNADLGAKVLKEAGELSRK
jgi:hypothetical protein